eukprot:gene36881-44744_t
MTRSKKNNVQWNQHPLISTVLWILGTELSQEQVEKPSRNGSHNNVCWKDEQGGNINEYISHIQLSPNSPLERKQSSSSLP